MMPPHGPLSGRAPGQGAPSAGHHSGAPGGPSPLPGQQHPAMPPRGPSHGMPPPAVPPGGPMHPGAMQPGMRPPVMSNQHPDVAMSEPDRIVIGNRVTVSNMDVGNSAMRGVPPPGYNAAGAAAAMAAAQGAGLAAAAAAAAARQQQYPYGQQYPYDYAAVYGAEWQQMMQQQSNAYAAAAAYGLDKHPKVSYDEECRKTGPNKNIKLLFLFDLNISWALFSSFFFSWALDNYH